MGGNSDLILILPQKSVLPLYSILYYTMVRLIMEKLVSACSLNSPFFLT